MLQFLLLPSQMWPCRSFLPAACGQHCPGMAAGQPHCDSDRDQREETQFQSRSRGKEGQPWHRSPWMAFGMSFPKVTRCAISELALSPGSQTPRGGSGLWALTLRFVPAEVPCPLHQPFPGLVLPFFWCQQGKESKALLTVFALPSCHPSHQWTFLPTIKALSLPTQGTSAWLPTSSIDELMPIAFPCLNYNYSSNAHGCLGDPVECLGKCCLNTGGWSLHYGMDLECVPEASAPLVPVWSIFAQYPLLSSSSSSWYGRAVVLIYWILTALCCHEEHCCCQTDVSERHVYFFLKCEL